MGSGLGAYEGLGNGSGLGNGVGIVLGTSVGDDVGTCEGPNVGSEGMSAQQRTSKLLTAASQLGAVLDRVDPGATE